MPNLIKDPLLLPNTARSAKTGAKNRVNSNSRTAAGQQLINQTLSAPSLRSLTGMNRKQVTTSSAAILRPKECPRQFRYGILSLSGATSNIVILELEVKIPDLPARVKVADGQVLTVHPNPIARPARPLQTCWQDRYGQVKTCFNKSDHVWSGSILSRFWHWKRSCARARKNWKIPRKNSRTETWKSAFSRNV